MAKNIRLFDWLKIDWQIDFSYLFFMLKQPQRMEAKVRDIVRNGIAQLVTDFDWPDFQDIQMKRVKNNHGVFRSDVAIRWYHKNLKHCSTQCTSPWKTAEVRSL